MCSFLSCQQCHEFLLYVLITTIKVVNYFSAYGLSLASRVESHDSVVWLRTGVSSGNRPTNVLKSRKCHMHRLKARTLGASGTPVSDAVGKLGDLGDRPGDKIRTLICLDWDPDCMFPFTDGLSCHRVSYLCYPLVTVRFRSILPLPIYSRLGALCSSKLSLLSHPPPFLSLPTTLNLSDLFSFPRALLCAAPLPTARGPSSHCVLSPSKFAKALGRSPSPQRQSS